MGKIKFIIIGLICLLVISILFALQLYNANQMLSREKDNLKNQNESLVAQINQTLQENQRLNERINSLRSELESVSEAKEDLNRKLTLLQKERDELVEKLKTLPALPTATSAPTPAPPETISIKEDAYWAKVLRDKKELEFQLENIRKELRDLQIKNEEVQRDKNALALEVKNLERDKQDLLRQIEYNKKSLEAKLENDQKLIDSLSQDLVRERNDKFQIQDSLKLIRSENLSLRRQLKSLHNRKIVLEKKLYEIQTRNSQLEKRFTEMETILKEKMAQIESLRKELAFSRAGVTPPLEEKPVELPPIVVRPQGPEVTGLTPSEPTSPLGKILVVNRENNFVIIDLGQEQGVKLADTFEVIRDNEVIAELEVIQLRKTVSACDIKRETTPIKVGDLVR